MMVGWDGFFSLCRAGTGGRADRAGVRRGSAGAGTARLPRVAGARIRRHRLGPQPDRHRRAGPGLRRADVDRFGYPFRPGFGGAAARPRPAARLGDLSREGTAGIGVQSAARDRTDPFRSGRGTPRDRVRGRRFPTDPACGLREDGRARRAAGLQSAVRPRHRPVLPPPFCCPRTTATTGTWARATRSASAPAGPVSISSPIPVSAWHIGRHGYTWEDAGSSRDRYATYTFHVT